MFSSSPNTTSFSKSMFFMEMFNGSIETFWQRLPLVSYTDNVLNHFHFQKTTENILCNFHSNIVSKKFGILFDKARNFSDDTFEKWPFLLSIELFIQSRWNYRLPVKISYTFLFFWIKIFQVLGIHTTKGINSPKELF